MSMSTWQALYYPVPASEATGSELEAAEHSLRKWRGLRDLEAHSIHTDVFDIRAEDGALSIDSATCALCARHAKSNGQTDCCQCVLVSVRGIACDRPVRASPYSAWNKGGDPEPMIALLEQAVERLKGEANAA